MKTTAIILPLVFAVLLSGNAFAGFTGGLSVNSSSNMLLRPDGESGTMVSMFAGAEKELGKASVSYDAGFGMLQHYDGIQFHHHTVETSYMIREKNEFAWNVAADGSIARFGDVTSLDGYYQYGGSSNMRLYLTETLLFRWKGDVSRRVYRIYDRESYIEASTVYRFDKFFSSGITLRGQVDAGWRQYDRQSKKPETALVGFNARTARSVKPWWGIMAEGFVRTLSASSKQDSSQVFNRIFLDDVYKYSSTGVMAGSTWLIKGSNSLQLRVYYSKREYSDTQTAYFGYLPSDGWSEYERSAYLTLAIRSRHLSYRIHPVIELYYTDVNASVDKFSYSGNGVSMRIEFR